jgi:hypothetical protein
VGSTLKGSGSPREHPQPSDRDAAPKPGISRIMLRAEYLSGAHKPVGGSRAAPAAVARAARVKGVRGPRVPSGAPPQPGLPLGLPTRDCGGAASQRMRAAAGLSTAPVGRRQGAGSVSGLSIGESNHPALEALRIAVVAGELRRFGGTKGAAKIMSKESAPMAAGFTGVPWISAQAGGRKIGFDEHGAAGSASMSAGRYPRSISALPCQSFRVSGPGRTQEARRPKPGKSVLPANFWRIDGAEAAA